MFIERLTGGPEAGQCGVSTVETYALLDQLEEVAQGCVRPRLSGEEWPCDCTELSGDVWRSGLRYSPVIIRLRVRAPLFPTSCALG